MKSDNWRCDPSFSSVRHHDVNRHTTYSRRDHATGASNMQATLLPFGSRRFGA
jgi:hypothetical protein